MPDAENLDSRLKVTLLTRRLVVIMSFTVPVSVVAVVKRQHESGHDARHEGRDEQQGPEPGPPDRSTRQLRQIHQNLKTD